MSNRRTHLDYLEDILESVADIKSFTTRMDYESFSTDKKTIHAVVRCLEIIGEAVKKIPKPIRTQHPDIPWIEIAGMRNKLIHEYFGVDLEIIWITIHEDLDSLEKAVRMITNKPNSEHK